MEQTVVKSEYQTCSIMHDCYVLVLQWQMTVRLSVEVTEWPTQPTITDERASCCSSRLYLPRVSTQRAKGKVEVGGASIASPEMYVNLL